MSDHFGTLCIKGLIQKSWVLENWKAQNFRIKNKKKYSRAIDSKISLTQEYHILMIKELLLYLSTFDGSLSKYFFFIIIASFDVNTTFYGTRKIVPWKTAPRQFPPTLS